MNGSPFWQLEYGNVQVSTVQARAWLWCLLGSGVSVLFAWLLGASSSSGFGWVWGYLAVLLGTHLYTRGRIQHELPAPNFARDRRTGNLEQFRLLPVHSHLLVLQRAKPGLYHRFQTMVLFLPAYTVWGAAVGLPLFDTFLFWAIFSFADYRLLLLLSVYLLLPLEQLEITCLLVLLLGYSWVRETGEAQFGKWTGMVFGLIVALCVLSRIPMGVQFALVLPDFRLIAFTMLFIEVLRFDRLSRWLNAASGTWTHFYLLPCAGLLFFVQYLFLQVYYDPAWDLESRALASMAAVFCLTGWLGILTGTYERAGRALQESFRHHLHEITILRGLSLLVLAAGLALYGIPITGMTVTGCGLFVLFSLLETGVQPLIRARLQAYGVLNRLASGYTIMGAMGLLPFVLASLPLNMLSYSILLSPSAALLALTPLWANVHALFPSTASSIAPAAVISIPFIRYALTAWLLARPPLPGSRWGALALRLLNALTLSPLFESRLLRNQRNPVYAAMLLTHRQSRTWIFYFPALLLSVANSWDQLIMILFCLTVPLIGLLWYFSYQGALRWTRKVIGSGEFAGWLMSKLTDSEIFWGIVYGGWWQQVRTIISFAAGLLMGQLLRGLFLFGGLLGITLSKGILLGATIGLTLGLLGVGAILLCLVLLTAPPMAVQDALIEADARATGKPQTGVKSLFCSVLFGLMALPCCALFSPIALIGLPIFSSQAFNLLKAVRRAPGERLRV